MELKDHRTHPKKNKKNKAHRKKKKIVHTGGWYHTVYLLPKIKKIKKNVPPVLPSPKYKCQEQSFPHKSRVIIYPNKSEIYARYLLVCKPSYGLELKDHRTHPRKAYKIAVLTIDFLLKRTKGNAIKETDKKKEHENEKTAKRQGKQLR